MEPWKIRAGTDSDRRAILALWGAAGGRPSLTDNGDAISKLLAADAGALLVAEVDGELVGTLIAAWDGWRGSFYRLAVDPRRRRQGLARALVRAGEERLAALGAERLTAIVADEVPAAGAFWKAIGYERQQATRRHVRMVGRPYDE
jgi:ribosomal protein S18 acetylase RimI-like enzyme